MKINWTHKAQNDLIAIGLYIKNNNQELAGKFIATLRKKIMIIKEHPQIGRIVPEINQDDIRELIYKNYRIVYKLKSRDIDILTVFEGHKLLEKGLGQDQSNSERRNQLLEKINARRVSDKVKEIDAVSLIREDRDR